MSAPQTQGLLGAFEYQTVTSTCSRAVEASAQKSDPGDALVLADILRTDMHAHRPLPGDSDLGRAISVLARAQQDSL